MTEVTNYSMLNGENFRFYIPDAPYLAFFVQNVNLPTISLTAAEQGTPFSTIHYPGDQLDWEPLSVTFAVDEDLQGYYEIYHWMKGLAFPTTFDEYKELVANEVYTSRWQETARDIQVTTMTGSRNGNIIFDFSDAHPISLTAPVLTTTAVGVQVLTCTVNFTYTYFDVKSIKNS